MIIFFRAHDRKDKSRLQVNQSARSGRIAETFFSIQGEGPTAGVPAVFVRLQGCSVGCGWCDTKYSWDPGGGRLVDLDDVVAEVTAHPCRRAVITGGEPLESSLFAPLCRALEQAGFALEVETSGTLAPPEQLPEAIQWNVSLKLENSAVEESRRIDGVAIRDLLARDSWWKFVVCHEAEVSEVLRLAERFSLPRERILLQPEALHSDDFVRRGRWIVEACKRHGFRFSPRLHIMLWGARRGV
jgi:7-carboxy-7-deazaguanine synthase